MKTLIQVVPFCIILLLLSLGGEYLFGRTAEFNHKRFLYSLFIIGVYILGRAVGRPQS